jgi:hypothetical protein
MKLRLILAALAIAIAPAFVFAQGKGNGKGHSKQKHNKTQKIVKTKEYRGYKVKGGPPPWAPAHGYRAKQHVYFPDYYTFYDPYRNGYVYWNNGWVFTPTTPGFLTNVNLGAARLQMLSNVPLTTRPEIYYNQYAQQYPAKAVNINVTIPRP